MEIQNLEELALPDGLFGMEATDEVDPDAWKDERGVPIEGPVSIEGEPSVYVTEVDASMQVWEDGDFPEDEDFEEGGL